MSDAAVPVIPELESLARPLSGLLATAMLLFAACGVGRVCTGRACRSLPQIVVNATAGLFAIAWLVAALTLTGIGDAFRWPMLVGALAASALALIIPRARNSPDAVHRRLTPPARPIRGERWTAALFWLSMLFTLGPTLALPTGWDELVYHHELPRRWNAIGRPDVLADLPYSAFPSLAELLFWLVSPIDSWLAPRLINWCVWLAAILLLRSSLHVRLPARLADLLTLSFGLSAAVLMVSANCYIEAFVLIGVAAMTWSLADDHSPTTLNTEDSLILGLLAGGTAAVKLTALPALALPALLGRTSSVPRMTWRQLSLAATVSIAVAAPFYIRPAMATGNPFYPYCDDWFTTNAERLEMSRFHHAIGASFGLRTLTGFISGPFLVATNDALYDGFFGWQLWILLPLAAWGALARREPANPSRPLLLAAGLLYLFWFLTAQQARFLTPAVLLLTMASANRLNRSTRSVQFVIAVALVATTVWSLPWRNAGYYFSSWETLAQQWTRTEMLADGAEADYVALVEAVRTTTPTDARLILLFEHRGLYLGRHVEIGTPRFRPEGLPRECERDASRLSEWLRTRPLGLLKSHDPALRPGATHVVIARTPLGPDQTPEWRDDVEYVYRAIENGVANGVLKVEWESPSHVLMSVPAENR
jgi:hypothetical protein